MPTTGGSRHSLPEGPVSPQVPPACRGWGPGGTREPQAQPQALQREVSVPRSRSSAGWWQYPLFKSGTRRETQAGKDAQTCSSYMMLPNILGCITQLTQVQPCSALVPLLQPRVLVAPLPPPQTARGEGTPHSAVSPATGMVYVTLIARL